VTKCEHIRKGKGTLSSTSRSGTATRGELLMGRMFISSLLWMIVAGCEISREKPLKTSENLPSSDRSQSVEAGIVFVDKNSYHCLPFEKIYLDEATVVTSVNTSCDCVRGSIVSYRKSQDEIAKGLLLEFGGEFDLQDSGFQPTNVGVVVTLSLESGRTHELIVNLLLTKLVVR